MTVIEIDKTTEAGKDMLRKPAEHPAAGQMRTNISRDEDDDQTWTPWEDMMEELYDDLSEHSGTDRRTISQDEETEDKEDEDAKMARIREKFLCSDMELDENGNPIGYSVEEVFDEIDKEMSEVYGIDFAKISRMMDSGELSDEDLTEELLESPEFEYKPYPGFKPKPRPVPEYDELDSYWLAALSEE